MAWIAPAIGGAAGIASGVLGGKKAKAPNPFKQAAAQFQTNNPTTSSFWGSREAVKDDMGTPKEYRDDVYTITETMNPELEAIAQGLLTHAGREIEPYQSTPMDTRLQGIYGNALDTYGQGRGERDSYKWDDEPQMRRPLRERRPPGAPQRRLPPDPNNIQPQQPTRDDYQAMMAGMQAPAPSGFEGLGEVSTAVQPGGAVLTEPNVEGYDPEAFQRIIESLSNQRWGQWQT